MRAACMLACFLGLQLCGQAWLCAGAAAQPQPPASPMPIVDHEYDAAGNPLRRIEARNSPGFGFTTRHEVDRLHRRRLSTDAGGGEVRWSTTGRGAVLATTDPRGLVTQTPRNGLADMTRLASPDTGQATMRYDAAGLLIQRTDSRGVTASWVHDALGRPSSASWSRGSETPLIHTWAYDEAGPETPYGVGRLTSSQAPRTSNRWGYDAQGRLTRFSQTVLPTPGANLQALGHTVLWHYDAGRLTGITYPSGRRLWLRHDQGRLSSVALSRDATSTPVELITGIVHSPFGAPAGWSWVLANGRLRAQLRQRDETGRLSLDTWGHRPADAGHRVRPSRHVHHRQHQQPAAGHPPGAAQPALRRDGQHDADQHPRRDGRVRLRTSIGLALVVPGALAIAGKTLPAQALNWQAGALAVLLCLLTLWGLTIMLGKPGQQITWMVGNLSGLAICLFHLVRHAVDPRRYASLRPILLGLCAVAIMVDVGVFARVGWF